MSSREKLRELIELGVTPEEYREAWEGHFNFCTFQVAWFGECGRTKKGGTQAVKSFVQGSRTHYLCSSHVLKCVLCGDDAIRECDWGTQQACAVPLCGQHTFVDHHPSVDPG